MLGFVLWIDWTLARQYTSRQMPVKSDQTLGWTRRSAAISVLLVLEEQRKRAGERVIKLREAKNWSQEDLASKAGLSTKTISRFENGRHEGRNDTIRKLARALRVNEVDITGPPPPPLGLETQTQEAPRVENELAGILAEIKDQLARQTAVLEEIKASIETEREVRKEAQEATQRLLDVVDAYRPALRAETQAPATEPEKRAK